MFALYYISIFIFLNNRTRSVSCSMTVYNEYLTIIWSLPFIKFIKQYVIIGGWWYTVYQKEEEEMTLLKYLTRGKNPSRKTNTMQ